MRARQLVSTPSFSWGSRAVGWSPDSAPGGANGKVVRRGRGRQATLDPHPPVGRLEASRCERVGLTLLPWDVIARRKLREQGRRGGGAQLCASLPASSAPTTGLQGHHSPGAEPLHTPGSLNAAGEAAPPTSTLHGEAPSRESQPPLLCRIPAGLPHPGEGAPPALSSTPWASARQPQAAAGAGAPFRPHPCPAGGAGEAPKLRVHPRCHVPPSRPRLPSRGPGERPDDQRGGHTRTAGCPRAWEGEAQAQLAPPGVGRPQSNLWTMELGRSGDWVLSGP